MKRFSIKKTVTIWYTLIMLLIVALVFSVGAFIAGYVGKSDTQMALKAVVDKNMDRIGYNNANLEAWDDFIYIRNGIFCIILDENGNIMQGSSPPVGEDIGPLEDCKVRTVEANHISYYVYDRAITFSPEEHYWLRGFTPTANNTVPFTTRIKSTVIVLPALIVATMLGGYFITKKTFDSIDGITLVASAIGESGELSRRIEIGEGKDEIHRLAETFNSMFGRLETALEQERQFTSDVTHELQTPIAILLAQCEFTLQYGETLAEYREAIETVQKQSSRMSGLIKQMLNFTKLERGTHELKTEYTNLSEAVTSLCFEQSMRGRKQIALEVEIEDHIFGMVDVMLFSRMVINLINNAFQYGKENGHIKVSFYRLHKKSILIVSDDGIGIAKENIPKIWNRFYQADNSRSTSGDGGAGLGLSMVQQIVHLHGGIVRVDSVLGKGSTFIVCLPLEQ